MHGLKGSYYGPWGNVSGERNMGKMHAGWSEVKPQVRNCKTGKIGFWKN